MGSGGIDWSVIATGMGAALVTNGREAAGVSGGSSHDRRSRGGRVMGETAACVYCGGAIHLEDQIFVVVNKTEVASQREWRYAHSECHESRPGVAVTGPQSSARR